MYQVRSYWSTLMSTMWGSYTFSLVSFLVLLSTFFPKDWQQKSRSGRDTFSSFFLEQPSVQEEGSSHETRVFNTMQSSAVSTPYLQTSVSSTANFMWFDILLLDLNCNLTCSSSSRAHCQEQSCQWGSVHASIAICVSMPCRFSSLTSRHCLRFLV